MILAGFLGGLIGFLVGWGEGVGVWDRGEGWRDSRGEGLEIRIWFGLLGRLILVTRTGTC